MRWNNGWLAILAISMVLPILRHGLAGEQLPLDYGNTELQANRSKSAYESRASNRAIRNPRNHDNYQESIPLTNTNAITDERLKSAPKPASSIERATTKEAKLRTVDTQERTDKYLADGRSARTEILDTIRNSPLSWIPNATIKNHSRTNEPRRREKQTLTSETPTGNQHADTGYSYYGHVPGNLQNDKFLKNFRNGREEKDDVKGFLTKEVGERQEDVGSFRETVENSTFDGHQSIHANNANPAFVDNESVNSTIVINETIENNGTDDFELINKWDNTSVYNLTNNGDSVTETILEGKENFDPNTEKLDVSFDLKSSNQTKREDYSSKFEGELTFNKSAVGENPMGNEILLKQGSLVDKNTRGDNGNVFSTEPDFPIAFTKSNTREYLSIMENSHDSNQNRGKTIPHEIVNFNNETNDYDENDLEFNFTFSMENESLISFADLHYNSSNQNYKIKESFNNETSDVQELDFIFDENNTTNNSMNVEDSISIGLNLNFDEPGTEFLIDNDPNNQDGKETDAIELNVTWIQLNEHEKGKFQFTQEEGSFSMNVTKDPVESLTERSMYSPITKMKEKNDTFENLSKTIEQQKNSKIKVQPSVNIKSKTSANSEEEKNIILFKIPLESSTIAQENRLINQSSLTISTVKLKERSNGSIMVSEDESLTPQNTVDKIRNNEPIVGFRWKNAESKGVGDRSGDNGTLNQVNPARNEGKDIEHSMDERSMDRRVSGIMASWIKQRFPKGRKSRSSKVASTTSTSLELGSFNLNELLEETTSSHENARRESKILNDPTVSSAHLLEFVLRNQSRNLTQIAQDIGAALFGENITFPTTEFDVLSTGNERASSGDGNPLATNGDEHTNVEDGLYKVNNSSVEMEPLNQWPVKHSAVVEGDLVLGGLMMVHEREDTVTCGPVMPQGGVQALEAMLYTLDRLNDREIVPGVKIGAHILDDCDKDTYGLEMAVDFIKGTCIHPSPS